MKQFLEKLSSGCKILYSEATLEELRIAATPQQREAIIATLHGIAFLARPYVDELLAVIGRYEKWVRRIGEHDVMIALAADANNAVLATGDWGQAKFYISLTGARPPKLLYIPVMQLKTGSQE